MLIPIVQQSANTFYNMDKFWKYMRICPQNPCTLNIKTMEQRLVYVTAPSVLENLLLLNFYGFLLPLNIF